MSEICLASFKPCQIDADKSYYFKEDKSRYITNNLSKDHVLIEGDNYHALKALMVTHAGKIDVIYIDPPYNTGNKDFMYNDKHSKWLGFMYKRLLLARELLSDTGGMFISIDDHEYAQLKLLCDRIFGEDNIETMIWEKVGDGNAAAGKMKQVERFRRDHEYILCCYKNINTIKFSKVLELPNFKNKYNNPDNDPRGAYKAGSISKTEDKSNVNGKNYYTVIAPSGRKITRQWHFAQDEFNLLDNENRIYWRKTGDAIPSIKIFVKEKRFMPAKSMVIHKGSLTSAKKEVENIFGHKFDNFTPKPVKLIKYLISLIPNKNSVILDFFAGSGTTGHAVLELNKEDNGNRQFILCTNNENNICTEVCYPRLKKVIEGIPANLVYFIIKEGR